jgi:hypothetical protein
MITLLVLLIIMNSYSTDNTAVDELLRNSYASYATEQLEKSEEYLMEYMKESPASHAGKIMMAMIMVREGRKDEAVSLLDELNGCDIESPECDSPLIHAAAYMLQGSLTGSDRILRKSEQLISDIFGGLYKKLYKAQIEVFLADENYRGVCMACDEYAAVSSDYFDAEIAMKCFVANWSCFDVENAQTFWPMLSLPQKNELMQSYSDINFQITSVSRNSLR